MAQLETVFYIVAIVYMTLSIFILLGTAIGVIYIVKAVSETKSRVEEKVKMVEKFVRHPDEAMALMGAALIKNGIRGARNFFRRDKKNH
jgi:hypothetical protein